MGFDFRSELETIDATEPLRPHGKVLQVVGMVVEASGPNAPVGDICLVHPDDGGHQREGTIPCEVVGFREGRILLMPYGDMRGIQPGSPVVATRSQSLCQAGEELLGRVIDGAGQAIDGKPQPRCNHKYPLYGREINPLTRARIVAPLSTGVKAVDALLTCGKGQRLGIFAGSGVGKSVTLGMIARNTSADVNVIALIGERGREVREFIERDLGEEGLRRSVVVVSTSEKSPLVKARGALVAITVAEYFRDQGKDVLLMMDSVTRFAMALREVGLAIGEPPTTKGYTPSVFAAMPRLMERAGMGEQKVGGSITGLYTVLVEGDDMNDPVADTVRSILDGHVVLSRAIAARNHYPAIDVLASASRLMMDIVGDAHRGAAARTRKLLAAYHDAEDLINIGAYQAGSNPDVDLAIAKRGALMEFLTQGIYERWTLDQAVDALCQIVVEEEDETVATPAGGRH
ncbi:MAG: FliI/YscN family ATPase [Deferrisomatales bacterium]|nr:FliI/YscN family ATPase [Deferrisomatales bacterium]